jgi:hypothetical protein
MKRWGARMEERSRLRADWDEPVACWDSSSVVSSTMTRTVFFFF